MLWLGKTCHIWVCNYGHWLTLHLREWLPCAPGERGGQVTSWADLLTTIVGIAVVLGQEQDPSGCGLHGVSRSSKSPAQGEWRGDLQYLRSHYLPRCRRGHCRSSQWQTCNTYQIFSKRTGWFRRKNPTDKMSRMFHSSSCILFSSLESYLCSLKTEVSPRYIIRLTLNKGLFAFFLFVTILSILCPVGNRHPENSTGRVLNSHAVQRMESFARQYWTKADNNRRWLNYNGF